MEIGERRQADEEPGRLAERLRLLTDALPALVSYIDTEERYRFANKAYEQWFGHGADLLHGKHLREVLGEAAFEGILPHVRAALAGRRVQYEMEVPYKDGGSRHVHAEYVPDTRPDGSIAGFFALVTDISERKRAEAASRAKERRLAS